MCTKESYDHQLYKHQEKIDTADAVAFTYLSKEKVDFFPYKQPELADNELRVNMLYAGLCMSDSHTGRSKWGPATYPLAPGHEIIGEVAEVGKKVTNFKKGDQVAFGTLRACCEKCKYCLSNKEPLCRGDCQEERFTYGLHWGGYSTQLQQPADFFFHLPKGLDVKRAAPLLCAGITVYNPIKQYAKPGMKTCVIGIGGLGHLAVQFLAKLGYEVTAVTNTMEKEKFIKSLGATNVITMKDKETLKNYYEKHDLIVNTLPISHGFEDYFYLCAPGCYFVQVGVPDVDEKVSFSINTIALKEIHLVGSLVGSRNDINEMLQLCVDKDIYPMVEEFAFEDFDKALDKLENGKPIFRCVVNCQDYAKKHGLFK